MSNRGNEETNVTLKKRKEKEYIYNLLALNKTNEIKWKKTFYQNLLVTSLKKSKSVAK